MISSDELARRSVEPGVVFDQVADRARDIFNRGKQIPIVLLDMDDTLLDRRPRMMKILADLIMDQSPENPLTDEVRAKIANVKPRTMSHDIERTLTAVGVADTPVLRWIVDEYRKRVWLDQYIMFDLPQPGSVDFIKELSKAGSMTIYLGGLRHKDRSRFGTERSISMYELPAPRGEVGALFMRDRDDQSEFEFKQDLVEPIREAGEVIAVFDNEPDACNLFRDAYPDAQVVMLDTVRESEDELKDGIQVMKNFIR